MPDPTFEQRKRKHRRAINRGLVVARNLLDCMQEADVADEDYREQEMLHALEEASVLIRVLLPALAPSDTKRTLASLRRAL